MTGVRTFRVKSRLASLAFTPGGLPAKEAVKRAEAGIEVLRPPCLADVDASLAEIVGRFGKGAPGRDHADLDTLYDLSSRVIECAIGLPDSGIDLAARALCEFVDQSIEHGVRDWEVIDIHIISLRLLRAEGQAMSGDQRAAVIEGLAKVTRKRSGGAPEALT